MLYRSEEKTSRQILSNNSKSFVYSLRLPTSCHHRGTLLFKFNSVRKNSDRCTKHEESLKVMISVNWNQKIISVFCTLVAPQSLPNRNVGGWCNGGQCPRLKDRPKNEQLAMKQSLDFENNLPAEGIILRYISKPETAF